MASNLSDARDFKSHQLAKIQAHKERQKLISMSRSANLDSSKASQPAVAARAPQRGLSHRQIFDSSVISQQAVLLGRTPKSNALKHSAVMGITPPGTAIPQSSQVAQTFDSPGISVPTLYIGNAQVCEKVSIGQSNALTIDNTVNPPVVSVNNAPIGGGPQPPATHMVYVRTGGSDIHGDGSIINPYATIPAAMAFTTVSPLFETMIDLGPGDFSDNFNWKAFVSIRGSTTLSSTISGHVDINDSSWNTNDAFFPIAEAQNLNFSTAPNIGFSYGLGSANGAFYFTDCNIGASGTTMIATGINNNNSINISGGICYCDLTDSGCFIQTQGTVFYGTISLTSSSTNDTGFIAVGGAIFNSNNIDITSTQPGFDVYLQLIVCPVIPLITPPATINVSGTTAFLVSDATSIPATSSVSVNLLSSAFFIPTSDLSTTSFVASSGTTWDPPEPTTALEAISRIATWLAMKNGTIPN